MEVMKNKVFESLLICADDNPAQMTGMRGGAALSRRMRRTLAPGLSVYIIHTGRV